MKKLLILIFLFVSSILLKAEVVIDSTNKIIYLKSVHKVEQISKAKLKAKAEEWVAKAYNNSNHVIKINNENQILVKGIFFVSVSYKSLGIVSYTKYKVDHTLNINFKEGRYKIEIIDLDISEDGIAEDLEFYFYSQEDYRKYLLKELESYKGNKKSALKRIESGRYVKTYNMLHDHCEGIAKQLIITLKSIDLDLLSDISKASEEDDW